MKQPINRYVLSALGVLVVCFSHAASNYTLSVLPSAWCESSYVRSFPAGTTLTFEASPTPGQMFLRWSDGNTDNPRTFVLAGNTALEAVFGTDPDSRHVVISTDECGTTLDTYYRLGTTLTFEAVPNEGSTFLRWSDGNTDNPRTLVLSEDTTLEAVFGVDPDICHVVVSTDECGTTLDTYYRLGTTLTFEAVPDEGGTFLRWSDGNTDNPRTVMVTSEISLRAEFESACVPVFNTVTVDLCEGETFSMPGGGITPIEWGVGITTITRTYTYGGGCDSIVTYSVNYHSKYNITLDETICADEYYEFGGNRLTKADTYIYEGSSMWGCDSVVTLNLVVESCEPEEPEPCQIETYSRNVPYGTWGTICLPYDVHAEDIQGVIEVAKPIAYKSYPGTIYFDIYYEKVDDMQAGHAYVFTPSEEGEARFSYCADGEPTAAVAASYKNALQGFIGANADDYMYVPLGAWVLHNTIWEHVVISETSDWIYSNRAYMVLDYLDDYSVIPPAQLASCRVVRGRTGGNVTTFTDDNQASESSVRPKKVLIDGHLFIIMPNGIHYSATGALVE